MWMLWRISTHILTKRMTRENRAWDNRRGYFNSHPHEEDDTILYCYTICFHISTHILTKRMTKVHYPTQFWYVISTHILTKRMTRCAVQEEFLLSDFNSHPHEEDDIKECNMRNTWDISTHILTKRMTVLEWLTLMEIVFQLTSSRRGWLWHNNVQIR